jgi:malonate transporter
VTGFLTALVPVILLVALGHVLSRRAWIAPEAFRAIERLSFLVLLPALVIRAIAQAEFETAPWRMIAALILAQAALGAIGLAARYWPSIARPAIGTIIQSNVRWNTIVALSIAALLFGDEGLALVSLAAAAMIPMANLVSVYALTAHAERPPGTRPKPLLALIRNPLVIASLLGIALAAGDVTLPAIADETLRLLAQAAIAMGLISAGAGIDLTALGRAGLRTLTWSVIRLAGLPLLTLGAGLILGLQGLPLAIAILCAATPTAPNSYVLARELGGDAPLAANLIAVQTVLAMLTLPLAWALILWMGAV